MEFDWGGGSGGFSNGPCSFHRPAAPLSPISNGSGEAWHVFKMASEKEKPANTKMKRLSDSETEMLISLVQGKPCLWNESHADFTNTGLRKKLWSLVGSHLHITGDEAKCKWKNLKDKFRKLRNIQEVRASLGITPAAPKWKFYNAMLFTKDVSPPDQMSSIYTNDDIGPTAECESLGSDDCSSVPSNMYDDLHNSDFLLEKPPSLEPFLPLSSTPQSKSRTSSKGSKRKKNSTGECSKILQNAEKKSTISPVSQEDKKGDDYHFLMSLLPYIEALDPLKKLELRFGIQKLVTSSYKKHLSKKGSKFRQNRGNQTER